MRYKFLNYLRRICKVRECEIAPKPIMFIYHVLFPLNWLYERQSNIKYDPLTNVYTINGMKFSANVFTMLRDRSKEGCEFQLTQTDGEICMIKEIRSNATTIRGESIIETLRKRNILLQNS